MIIALMVSSLVVVVCWRRLGRRAEVRRVAGLDGALAPTIDLLAVVLGSGGTVGGAVATVAAVGPAPVRPSFERAVQRSARGELLADSLVPLGDELSAAFHPLVGALVGAARDGGPVGPLLQRLADEADHARRNQAEALARRLPVSLMVPLVVCQLPAVIVGAVVPLAIVALRRLGG
ncbi:MAG: type II secretion system F family protein [Actinomycetota bacterium]